MLKDKNQVAKLPNEVLPKKPMDVGPPQPQLGPLSAYGMYPFYPHAQPPYLVQSPQTQPTDLQSNKSQAPPQPQVLAPPSMPDYSKMKEPPLDLMTKPAQQSDPPPLNLKDSLPPGPPPPMTQTGKLSRPTGKDAVVDNFPVAMNYYPYK